MLKARWTQFGPPSTPRVVFVRGIGDVRVTQEDIDRYSAMPGDPEVVCEHVADDPEASHRIVGLAPETPSVQAPTTREPVEVAARPSSARSRRPARRSWLDVLLRR
ncbi:MAG: hypothetical protein AB7Y46_12935 [Armatimonadota bacterium]